MKKMKLVACAACVLVLGVMVFGITRGVFARNQDTESKITGTITGHDGHPLAGVQVSVRGENQQYDTTVFTDEKGVYAFPPLKGNGKYQLWAQAMGFAVARTRVTPGDAVPTIKLESLDNEGLAKQMTGVEWMNSFPGTVRDKLVYANNCSGCHAEGWALQNRFDVDGWTKIVNVMAHDNEGVANEDFLENPNAPAAPPRFAMATMLEYKSQIAEFLAGVRGVQPPNYPLKPLPRPTGAAAQVVMTQYYVARPEAPPEYVEDLSGREWEKGIPTRWGRLMHSTAVGGDGHVYASSNQSPSATIIDLDPASGTTQNLIWRCDNGGTATSHGITTDANGNIWVNNACTGNFLEFDVKTRRFKDWPRPADMIAAKQSVGGTLDADRYAYKGKVYATSGNSIIGMDGATGKYTYYPNPNSKGTYGIAIDRHGNIWYDGIENDQVWEIDPETNKITTVSFRPQGSWNGVGATPMDENAYAHTHVGPDDASPIQVAPRRMGTDPNADLAWVALFCEDAMAEIDTKTGSIVATYPMPYKYSRPYGATVDNDHNVWINTENEDAITKFDPKTKQFTTYQLPDHGTDVRQIAIAYSGGSEVVYAAYSRENEIVGLHLR